MNLNALPRGRDRAIPIGELAEQLNVSRRRMEQNLEALVLSGVPVVACERGVYRSDSAEEVRSYANQLEGRILSQMKRIRALRRAADRMEAKQQTLWAA